MFVKASKSKSKLRLLIEGASGSGKTYSSLILAKGLGEKVAVIDTEKGSASLYADKFNFDVLELSPPYSPERYIEAIQSAEKAGYDVLIIDSMTHEWSGEGGCLDIHSKLGGNSYIAWGRVTPRHNNFIESILRANLHIIGTARTKSDVVLEESANKQGKMVQTPIKKGMKTEQRDGLDFEFTTVLRLNENHVFTATKDRTGLFDSREGVVCNQTAIDLMAWLNDGKERITPLKDAENAIDKVKDVQELRKVWEDLPLSLKKDLEDKKESKKIALVGGVA